MTRSNIGPAKADWLSFLEDEATAHDSSVVHPDTSEYDLPLVRGSTHTRGILQTISSIVHDPQKIPDDAYALGVVRVSEAAHRKALVEMPGHLTHQYFFFDIHGPLVLLQKHADLRVYFVILDVYSEEGFDPERDHMVVLPGDVIKDESGKQGPYLQLSVHGPGQYESPADEYVDEWALLFEGRHSSGESSLDKNE